MTKKKEVVVLLGAGASAHMGVPITSELTTEVIKHQLKGLVDDRILWISDPKFDQHMQLSAHAWDIGAIDFSKGNPDFSQVRPIFEVTHEILKRKFDYPNFEHILAALEDLESISSTQQHQMKDDFKAVIAPFVSITSEHQMLSQPNFLHYAIEDLIKLISKIFQARLSAKPHPEQETKIFFDGIRDEYSISVFNLNYDNLLEMTGYPLQDGFTESRGDFSAFSIKDFQAAVKAGDELHCHLHGSLLFGYPRTGTDLMSQLVKYASPELALHSLETISTSGTNVKGSDVTGRPLISGFNKLSKLHYQPSPYRAYFRAFSECLNRCERLLIVGYGGADDHINSLIREYMSEHGQKKRVAYLLPRRGCDVAKDAAKDKLLIDIAQPTDFFHSNKAWYEKDRNPVEFSTYGNLALCAAGFPLQDVTSLGKIIDFLNS